MPELPDLEVFAKAIPDAGVKELLRAINHVLYRESVDFKGAPP